MSAKILYSDPPYFAVSAIAVSVLRGVFLRIRENSRNIRRKPQKAQTNFSNHARVTSASLGYIRPESAAERRESGSPLSISLGTRESRHARRAVIGRISIAGIPLVVFYQNKRQQNSLVRVEIPNLGNLGLFRRKDTYKSLGKKHRMCI